MISHGLTRKEDTQFRAGSVSDGNTLSLGAKFKGSNGVVAVGLPHRNYSVLKQAHVNEWEVKRKNKNGPPLFSEGDEYGKGLTGARASEAKGPFPGGKRVGSWGKKKIEKEAKEKGTGRGII